MCLHICVNLYIFNEEKNPIQQVSPQPFLFIYHEVEYREKTEDM